MLASPAASEWLSTRTKPCRRVSEAGGRYHVVSDAVTVTAKVCLAVLPPASSAVTVISAVPRPTPRTVSVSPSTATVATDSSEDSAA